MNPPNKHISASLSPVNLKRRVRHRRDEPNQWAFAHLPAAPRWQNSSAEHHRHRTLVVFLPFLSSRKPKSTVAYSQIPSEPVCMRTTSYPRAQKYVCIGLIDHTPKEVELWVHGIDRWSRRYLSWKLRKGCSEYFSMSCGLRYSRRPRHSLSPTDLRTKGSPSSI